MVLSAMLDDAEKSIHLMTGETNSELDKMEILGEFKKSNLSTLVAKNAGLKWTKERMLGVETMQKHSVTSLRCVYIMQKSPIGKNEMSQNREHTNYFIS